jgi:tRNA(Arg) A34 adenosine deaminase TadA
MSEEKFMRLAIEKAREGMKKGQSPFGACVVKNGEVISCVHNVVWQTTDITAHAEVHAIREACKKLGVVDLEGCVIYSTCEPCPMCFSAIHWANISKIVFGGRIADAQDGGFSELTIPNEEMKKLGGSPVEIVAGFMKKENVELFEEWGRLEKRRVY